MKYLKLVFLLLINYSINAQTFSDTLIEYDVVMQTYDTILPVLYSDTVQFDYSNSSIGNFGNSILLSLTPPTDSLFIGSDFNWPHIAHDYYSVESYPLRTSCKLAFYRDTTVIIGGTANLVSRSHILASAVNFFDHFTNQYEWDSVVILPAYDNGVPNPNLPTPKVVSVTYAIHATDLGNIRALSLVKLSQPIGSNLGWIGFGFSTDDSYFAGKVFHKFSYPTGYRPIDSLYYYDGNNMMYNYGYLSHFTPNDIGVLSNDAILFHGQGGSSVIYTNNTEYYTMGCGSFSHNYCHERIKPSLFYAFKSYLGDFLSVVEIPSEQNNDFTMFPNPASETVTIQNQSNTRIDEIIIYKLSGEFVLSILPKSKSQIISLNQLAAGIYIIEVKTGSESIRQKLAIQ